MQDLPLFESVIAAATDAVVITEAVPLDPPGPRIVYVNRAFQEMTGYSPAEVLGKTPGLWHGPRTQRAVLEEIRSSLLAERPVRAELVNYRKDGSEFWTDVSIVPIRSAEGPITHFAAVKHDVTHRKQVEDALQRNELINQALLNAIPDLMFRISGDGIFLDCRPAKDIELLVLPEQFLGKTVLGLMPPDLGPRCMTTIRRALDTGITQGLEFQLVIRGEPRDYEARVAVCGELEVLALVRDMTERKRLEKQFLHAQKLEAVARLAGGVAHDFNNILTVIGGYAQFLLDSLAAGDKLRQAATEILRATDRADALTQRLLSFTGQRAVQPKVMQLNPIISGLEQLIRRLIGEDVEFETRLAEDLWPVKGEPSQIEQILLNLLVNARDAMSCGGRVVVETANVERAAPPLVEDGLLSGACVRLSVSDTGAGMNGETRSHVFEPFFTTKEPGKGTGLGLYTVYGIVKQLGGDVEVLSEPGFGTTVRIYLPRAAGVPEEQEADVGRRPTPGGNETVLLVEDEADVRRLVSEMLARHGYSVLEAPGPLEALKICVGAKAPVHVLLTDVVMPHMGGGELARRVKRVLPDIRVLYISGYPREAAGLEGGFLPKPFSAETLLHKLREVLEPAS